MKENILCYKCQYGGDKYSFPLPNDLQETEHDGSKCYYCCNGDSENYMQNVTGLKIKSCNDFDEL